MKSKFRRGFTLIELLVVIAIIGILASIVLVSFPGATKKAKDSRIISAIAQARTVMTYIYANDGKYDNFTCSHAEMTALCTEVGNNHPTKGTNPSFAYAPATISTSTCIFSALNSGGYYCADSIGLAGSTTTDPGTVGCTTALGAKCPGGLQ